MLVMDTPSLAGATILIVDDTLTNIEVLYRLLETESYQIVVANSGERAIKIALDAPPDLILLDVVMPGLDGIETCKRIKAEPCLQDVPIIFVTGKTDAKDVLQGFHAGGVDYIAKPFLEEEVRARVRTQLGLRYFCKERGRLLEVERSQGEYLRTIINNVADGILRTDELGCLITVNPAVERMFGYAADEVKGKALSYLLVEPYATEYSRYFSPIGEENSPSIGHGRREIVGCKKDGTRFSFDFSLGDMYAEQHVYIGVLHDVSLPRRLAEEVSQVPLEVAKGLASCQQCKAVLEKEWARARRSQISVALLLVEPDHWASYLSQHNAQAVKKSLQKIGNTLASFAKRPADYAAFREGLGFCLLLPDTGRSGARVVAERLRMEIERMKIDFPSAAAKVVTVSIGLKVVIPGPDKSAELLLAESQIALQQAKQSGGNCVM